MTNRPNQNTMDRSNQDTIDRPNQNRIDRQQSLSSITIAPREVVNFIEPVHVGSLRIGAEAAVSFSIIGVTVYANDVEAQVRGINTDHQEAVIAILGQANVHLMEHGGE